MAKKLLVICEKKLNTGFLSGIELRVLQMVDYFRELGLIVDIASPEDKFFPWNLVLQANRYDFVYYLQASSKQSAAYFLANVPVKAKRIIDLYTPLLLEKASYTSKEDLPKVSDRIKKVVAKGDFFICATPRQKEYYNLKNLAIVPFIPQEPQISKRKINKNSFTLVWLGAFYPWFSPENLIKAINLIKDDNLKLIIIGGKNPKTDTFDPNFENISKLADNKKITFYPWLKYEEMFKILRTANAGVCLSNNSPEDKLAIRSRMISMLQANLPLIVNGNDEISEIVEKFTLGVKLKANTPEVVVQAIRNLMDRNYSKNIWETVENNVHSWQDDISLRRFLI